MKRSIRRHHEKRLTKKRIRNLLITLDIYIDENGVKYHQPKLCNLTKKSFNNYQKHYKHQSVPCSCDCCSPNKFKRKKLTRKFINTELDCL